MSDFNPVVAFGLLATTVALKAKTGRLKDRDRMSLMQSALFWCDVMPEARVAALDFFEAVDSYPLFAGETLQEAARVMAMPQATLGDPGGRLKVLESEAVASGWADRKDCGHG